MVSKHKCQLSFVIPVLNEAKRLPTTLKEIATFSASIEAAHEWLFIVEPSRDTSLQIIQAYCTENKNSRYIANEKQIGKGYAVQSGLLNARGQWAFFMDADLATPLKEIKKFQIEMQNNPEVKVFIGSRRLSNSLVTKPTSLIRQILSLGLNTLVKTLGLANFSDTQCGFKAFHFSVISDLFGHLNNKGYSFDIEILSRAKKKNINVKEVAVEWADIDASKVNPMRDSLRFFIDLIMIRLRL